MDWRAREADLRRAPAAAPAAVWGGGGSRHHVVWRAGTGTTRALGPEPALTTPAAVPRCTSARSALARTARVNRARADDVHAHLHRPTSGFPLSGSASATSSTPPSAARWRREHMSVGDSKVIDRRTANSNGASRYARGKRKPGHPIAYARPSRRRAGMLGWFGSPLGRIFQGILGIALLWFGMAQATELGLLRDDDRADCHGHSSGATSVSLAPTPVRSGPVSLRSHRLRRGDGTTR